MLYAHIDEANAVDWGPGLLPGAWKNVSNLAALTTSELRAIGFVETTDVQVPYVAGKAAPAPVYDAATDKVIVSTMAAAPVSAAQKAWDDKRAADLALLTSIATGTAAPVATVVKLAEVQAAAVRVLLNTPARPT